MSTSETVYGVHNETYNKNTDHSLHPKKEKNCLSVKCFPSLSTNTDCSCSEWDALRNRINSKLLRSSGWSQWNRFLQPNVVTLQGDDSSTSLRTRCSTTSQDLSFLPLNQTLINLEETLFRLYILSNLGTRVSPLIVFILLESRHSEILFPNPDFSCFSGLTQYQLL